MEQANVTNTINFSNTNQPSLKVETSGMQDEFEQSVKEIALLICSQPEEYST